MTNTTTNIFRNPNYLTQLTAGDQLFCTFDGHLISCYTGDKNPCTEPVYAKYMLVTCPEYQNFPESEYAKFFQNMLNNVSTISQPSILWGCSKRTDPLGPQYPPLANVQYF